MKTTARFAAFGLSLLAVNAMCRADTIERKDGTVIEGRYVGGTAKTISLETPQGVLAVQTADVASLKFSEAAATPATEIPPTPKAAPAVAGPISISGGTVLTVKMDSQVSSTDKAGTKFTAQLVGDLKAGEVTVAKAGTTVYGKVNESKQAGRLAGKSKFSISLTGVDLAGKVLPITTTNYAEVGKGEFRKTARNVAGGALIGNAIDDDGGAGKGAAVGAGASLIKKGDAVTVPPGALLEFRLTQPVNVMP